MSRADSGGERGLAHVILTRFNLPTPGPESLVRAQEGWLRTRWGLFTRFTVPAMRAQTEQRFRWIVYFDPESPQWLKDGISLHQAEGLYTPIYRDRVTVDDVVDDIRWHVRPEAELLTTNLDNDDGLADDFVARLQAHRPAASRAAVYLTRGLILSGDGLYLRRDRNNAFCSVREPWEQPMTCWCDWHVLLGRHMATSEIAGAPAWLQVVHGTNVSNRVHGRLVAPAPYRPRFPGALDRLPVPGRSRLLLDRAVLGPARAARDALRLALKSGLMRLGGKDAVDRLKEALSGTHGEHRASSSRSGV